MPYGKRNPCFDVKNISRGRSIRGEGQSDISWIGTDGKEVNDEVWNAGFVKCLGLRLDGKLIGELDDHGEAIEGDTVLLLLNAHHENVPFMLPTPVENAYWEPLMDTAQFPGHLNNTKAGTEYEVFGRSIALLRLTTPTKEEQQKQGFVSAEVIAEAGMDAPSTSKQSEEMISA